MRAMPKSRHTETWTSRYSPGGTGKTYKLDVQLGKPVEIFSLKSGVINKFPSHISHTRSTRRSLFKSKKLKRVSKCPICASPVKDSKFLINVYGADYRQCIYCSHCFLIKRPTESALKKFYSYDNWYASTYADKKSVHTRVRQVAIPKAKWMIDRFNALYKRMPRAVTDVGAGAGHFVHACKELGLKAYGVELSNSCIDFCKNNFDINLEPVDFTKGWNAFSDTDIITFWGVIEHLPRPLDLLRAAHKLLSGKDGIIIVEVPRWDSLSTAIQCLSPDRIIRHLDPLGHINIFTDSSLLTAFEISGFTPVAAWYFGMDGYELTTQLSYLLGDKRIMKELKKHTASMQHKIDQSRLSDTIVLAGKPRKLLL